MPSRAMILLLSCVWLSFPGDDIDGVILCNPFLGNKSIFREIEGSRGINNWSLPEKTDDKWQYQLWGWIKDYLDNNENYPPIFLGYGIKDNIAGKGPELLATALDRKNVFTVIGGHDYPTFQKLWSMHLDRLEKRLEALP